MNVQWDFGNSSPVIRYNPELQSGLPLLPGLETKVCAINSKLPNCAPFDSIQSGKCILPTKNSSIVLTS